MASSYTIQRLTLEDLTGWFIYTSQRAVRDDADSALHCMKFSLDDVLGHLSDMHVKAFVNGERLEE